MASVINATTGGLVTTADISGILQLATNNGSTAITIDASQNVGIGTSSPTQKLQINGGLYITSSATLPARGGAGLFSNEYPVTRAYIGDGTGYTWAFSKRLSSVTTDLVTIADTGNVGIGVTPNAWGTGTAFQGPGGTLWFRSAADGVNLLYNYAYYSGANIYLENGYASRYTQVNGQHVWFNAPSGTAGNTISFTQAMTLDASGNLGIGTTSPILRFDVGVAYSAGAIQDAAIFHQVSGTDPATGQGARIYLAANSSTSRAAAIQALVTDGLNGHSLQFLTQQAGNTPAVRATIDASGNLGLGVTPSAWSIGKAIELGSVGSSLWDSGSYDLYLSMNSNYNSGWKYTTTGNALQYRQQRGTGAHSWYIAPSGTAGNTISFTQAMTLDANGTLLVGTTSAPSTNNVLAMVVGKNPKMYFFSDPTQSQAATNGIRVDTYGNSKWAGYAFNNGNGVYTNSSSAATTYIASASSNAIAFGSMNNNPFENTSSVNAFSEFARIDGSGNLLIGTTTTVASAKAVVSSTTQGFLPPVMTTTQKNAISSPAAGLIVFDTTLAKLCVYSGSAWQTITSV